MVHLSREEFNRFVRLQREKSAIRKAKRQEKGIALGLRTTPAASQDDCGGLRTPVRGVRLGKPRRTHIRQVSNRQGIKDSIVTLLGLLDRKLNGNQCRLGHLCPAWRDLGPHAGQVGYHLIPQKRGDAARFLQENVVWACRRANYGEQQNRDLYAKHHETLFGVSRMARLWAISRTIKKYTDAELRELRAEIKAELEKV